MPRRVILSPKLSLGEKKKPWTKNCRSNPAGVEPRAWAAGAPGTEGRAQGHVVAGLAGGAGDRGAAPAGAVEHRLRRGYVRGLRRPLRGGRRPGVRGRGALQPSRLATARAAGATHAHASAPRTRGGRCKQAKLGGGRARPGAGSPVLVPGSGGHHAHGGRSAGAAATAHARITHWLSGEGREGGGHGAVAESTTVRSRPLSNLSCASCAAADR
jgi:hypothetical protein